MFGVIKNKLDSVNTLSELLGNAKIEKSNAENLASKMEQRAKDAEQRLAIIESELKLSKEFKTGLQKNYLDPYYAQFGASIGMPPIKDAEKQIFTATIYSIAFHVLSYCKSQQNEFDKSNLEAITMNTVQNYKEEISLNQSLDTHKYNAIVVHIVEELKRNKVTSLNNVNYSGLGFGA
jgi:hypothetical protein